LENKSEEKKKTIEKYQYQWCNFLFYVETKKKPGIP